MLHFLFLVINFARLIPTSRLAHLQKIVHKTFEMGELNPAMRDTLMQPIFT